MTSKICCFFNYPSHYRESIYNLMDKEIGCDFVFGDEEPSIKEMDCGVLSNVKRVHYTWILKKILYIKNVLLYLVLNYDTIVVTPATNSITHWLLLLLYKMLPNRRIYYWTHGLYGWESKRQLFFKNLMFKNATGLFLYGNYAKKIMIANGYNPNKMHVVFNSMDYDNQINLRERIESSDIFKKHFNNSNSTIIVIGRLNRRKKIDLLVNAVNNLKNKDIIINVVIVGDGEEKERLEQMVSDFDLKKQFWFYGACYDEYTNAELIYNSDLCVVPGDIGLTAIHAMTYGVPVISHDCFPSQGPEIEIIEPGVTGKLFKYDDVLSLTAAIHDWLIMKGPDRNHIREACYSVIENHWNPYYQLTVLKKVLLGTS